MTLAELRQKCLDKIARCEDTTLPPVPYEIALVIPGRCSGNSKRLAGRKGPLGEVVSECEDSCVVAFDARKVLAWVDAVQKETP